MAGYGVKTIPEGKFGSRPSWDEYFMGIATMVSRRATCHNVRAGSVFVDENNRILGTGYNGAPSGKTSCLEVGCRKKKAGLDYEDSLNIGMCVGMHSEMNAVGHMSAITQQGSTLYATISPCHGCAKNLVSYKVKRVVFKKEYSDKETDRAFHYLESMGVSVEQLDLSLDRLVDVLVSQFEVKFDIFSRDEIERGRKVLKSLRRMKR